MSNIYIQEPPTNGKVLLKTTVGEIEVELWTKEAPKTCRNFVQLCLDGFYNKTLFHRLVSNFIVQCGENQELPVCIEPIKNEFHSRLRFNRRGLVGMANSDGSGNMEFFFTLDATPELQNTHTIFGKVTGETIFNLIKLNDSETDSNERPLFPHKINKVKILNNPFDDLSPRLELMKSSKSESSDSKKPKREGVKNFKLISFGDEAELDEQEVVSFPKESETSKPSKPILKEEAKPQKKEEPSSSKAQKESKKSPPPKIVNEVSEDSDSDYETTKEKTRLSELERKRKEIQDEIMSIKKQYHKDRKTKTEKPEEPKSAPVENESEAVQDYLEEKEKYKKKKLNSKGSSREDFTLSLLAKFKNKLHSALETQEEDKPKPTEENSDDENWLAHKLDFSESQDAVLAKDASKKQDDWYDIYDPRNPINRRKRGADAERSGASSKRSK